MRKIITFLIFRLYLFEYKWARKHVGGNWYLHRTALPMGDTWFQRVVKTCQAKVIKIEIYPEVKGHFYPEHLERYV
jgi:hypothetical protein